MVPEGLRPPWRPLRLLKSRQEGHSLRSEERSLR